MRRDIVTAAVITGLLGAAAPAARAQAPGRIYGVVHAAGQHPHADSSIAHPTVDGVALRLLETRYRAWSDTSGAFAFGPVPPGVYVLEARRLGYRPARQTVRVEPGRDIEVALHLTPAPITVDAVVVEALVDEGRRTYDLSALQKVPPVGTANVTTVTAGELREVHARNPWDLVRETTGLEVHEQGQGPGFPSDAVIRGFTSDHSTDVALVVDGVPVNQPMNGHGEGYADWNLLFPAATADLQVIKGPVSPLFGNFAAGGVVNVTTPASTGRTVVELEGGSYTYTSGAITSGFERAGWGGFLGVHGVRSEGWRENSGYYASQAIARGNRHLSPEWLVDAGAQYYRTGWDSPGYLSLADFDAGLLTQAADPTDGGDKFRFQGRLSTVFTRSNLQWQTVLWGYQSRWHLFLTIPELGGEGEGLGGQTEELDHRTAFGGKSFARWVRGPLELSAGVEGQAHDVSYGIWTTTARQRDLTVNR